MLNNIKIAFSICGEGHGHYGRNLEIIKELLRRFPKCRIDLYLYGETLNIFQMDKEICKKVNIRTINGFRFVYKNTGIFTSLLSTIFNLNNLSVFSNILIMNFLNFLKNILQFFIKKNISFPKIYKSYFDDFDFAITDLEPFLPRVALLRNKPFITFDNQHSMIYGDFDLKKFNFSEKLELFFVSTFLRIYHPKSDLSVLTTFCEVKVKQKYKSEIKSIGPLIRNDVLKLKKKSKYKKFILIYAHKYLREILFPILCEINNFNFIVFTTDDFGSNDFPYKRKWIEYHHIDPKKFIEKLAFCEAIISTAGNTLLSEALFLKKPFFAIGLEGQFEQRLNVNLLKKYKWGDGCNFSDVKTVYIKKFLNDLEKYKNNLQKAKIEDHTSKIVDIIEKKIQNDLS